MDIRIYGLVNDSIVDGPGLRFSVFTQGCPFACEGCHNPESRSFYSGKIYDTSQIIAQFSKNPLLSGITLTGGEPFAQSAACKHIAIAAHAMGLNVWAYSGYTYETLIHNEPGLLNQLDVLVDGPFILDERSLSLKYCGSRNQRIIDILKTRETGQIVTWTGPDWLSH